MNTGEARPDRTSSTVTSTPTLPCPECSQPTDRLKCYRLGFVFFFLVGAWWRTKDASACPKCMRTKLLEFTVMNIPTANIGWLIGILPVSIAYWLDLSMPGHSRIVLERAAAGEFGEEWQAIANRLLEQPRVGNPILTRLLGMVMMVIAVLSILVVTSLLTERWYRFTPQKFPSRFGISSAIAAVAGVLLWFGSGKLLLKSRGWKSLGLSSLVGGVMFATLCPMIAKGFWSYQERTLAANPVADGYTEEIPPQFWMIEPLQQVANHLISHLNDNPHYCRRKLEEMRRSIAKHHDGKVAFDELAARIQKRLDQTDHSR